MNEFLRETLEGLSSEDKYLLSKYFYDEEGDRLFQEIMQLDEYYLTRAERSILKDQSEEICAFLPKASHFRMAELGAGDGSKTTYLLEEMLKQKLSFTYHPVDISANALELLRDTLASSLPNLEFEGITAEYFEALKQLHAMEDQPLLVLFLGSNIGNFRRDNVDLFVSQLSESLKPGDQLLLGVDLKKDPHRILAAYNDNRGITAAFNFNILKRINEDFDANFQIDQFRHYNSYDPHSGECRSYLVSLKDQEVRIGAAQQSFEFCKHEAIHTETSRKYSPKELQALAARHNFKIKATFTDPEQLFADQIWERV